MNPISKWLEKRREKRDREIHAIVCKAVSMYEGRIVSDIGMQDLEKIVEQAKKNRAETGHNDYTNLAKMLGEAINARRNRM